MTIILSTTTILSLTTLNWTNFCDTGLTPWIPDKNELAPCFQQICLQLPVLLLFALASAYHYGRQSVRHVSRDTLQLKMLYFRISTVFIFLLLPGLKLIIMITHKYPIQPIDTLLICVESITWLIHLGYLFVIRNNGCLNHRGPLTIFVLWLSMFIITILWLKTNILLSHWQLPMFLFCLHVIYALTLLPNGQARYERRINIEEQERESLLRGNAYIRFQDDIDEMALGHCHDDTSLIAKLLFNWVEPLIRKGCSGNLRQIDDLFDLPNSLSIRKIPEKLQIAINSTKTLFRALHKSFGCEFYAIGILRLIADLSGFLGPIMLNGLLSQNTNERLINTDDDAGDPTNNTSFNWKPYLYTFGLFGSALLSSFCGTHFNWRISIISMKMRMGMVTAIYRKALEARGLNEAQPEILNLMSTDTDRIVNSCISFHSFWSIPFQLIITLFLLYTQIKSAFIAGVIFAVALIPINRWIAVKIGSLSEGLMKAKDNRVSLTSESLAGAKQIKLLTWEDVFIDKIEEFRKIELKFLSKRKYLDALCVYFWATTPVLMCLLTFGVATVFYGNTLTAATTFTSVALLNMLIGPLNAFPWVLNGLVEASVSLKRVQELLKLKNIDLKSFYTKYEEQAISTAVAATGNTEKTTNQKPIVIDIKSAKFEFDQLRSRQTHDMSTSRVFDFELTIENMEVKEGDLVCIDGSVGSGKTSLISAMLGGLTRSYGTIAIKNYNFGFGYVSQSPWLQRGTIRENILWGSTFDEQFYKRVLWACALIEDLQILGGDLIGVGEGGRTLSGGQRARVALARAVYQNKSIYLLDDILSAVDAHVAQHIVKNCLLGILRNKTRIIVTEHKILMGHADSVYHIENGTVELMENDKSSLESVTDHQHDDEIGSHMDDMNIIDIEINLEDNKSIDSVMLEETKEYGTLSPKVFLSYWQAISCPIGIILLLSVVLMQTSRNVSDAWLAFWVSDDKNTNHNKTNISNSYDYVNDMLLLQQNHTTNFYFEIYASIAILNSIITLLRSFLFAYAGLKAAKFIHKKLLNCVFYTKFKFFDVTPLGRIINRFSSDTYTIDDSLPFILNILLAQMAGLIGAICISLYAMPLLALIIIPLVPVYINLQNRYRNSSRDIKRLSSNALSPIYAHFTETLQGLVTIRAMKGTVRFRRDFLVKLEESIRAQITASAAQQWLSLRLQFLGAVIIGGAGLMAALTSAHENNPGLVGLTISYALSITGLLAGVLNALAETEQEMIAVERVNSYSKLKPEKNADGSIEPTFGWPCQGVITYKNVNLKYRKNVPSSLNNINLEINTCERIGIVGRTGAGKSSMLAALLRVVPITSGQITIDCIDISTLPLNVLRNRIAIVPQEPFLFTGTVRENLDPRNLHLDSEIWNALTNCLATPLIQSLGGLTGQINAGGTNLSSGQKQLLCLARALLKNSKIVCIDEGTANLDSESEATMQLVLRNAFKTSTVLLIAHRLNGLQQCDRIVVMDNGFIEEEGNPTILSNDVNTLFYGMLNEQQQQQHEKHHRNRNFIE